MAVAVPAEVRRLIVQHLAAALAAAWRREHDRPTQPPRELHVEDQAASLTMCDRGRP